MSAKIVDTFIGVAADPRNSAGLRPCKNCWIDNPTLATYGGYHMLCTPCRGCGQKTRKIGETEYTGLYGGYHKCCK